jgi:hypothetical protein
MFPENIPCLMLAAEGIVYNDELKYPFIAPTMMKPFMLLIEAVITTLVKPETGEEIDMMGVV